MKKVLIALGFIFGAILVYLLYREVQLNPSISNTATSTVGTLATTTDSKNFTSADKRLSFVYASTLSVSEKNNVVSLQHSISYRHTDGCDFKGDSPEISQLTDFNVTFRILPMTIASSAQIIDLSLFPQNIVDNTLKIQPGFIDPYNTASWNGYRVTRGVEGCGNITYYLPLSSSRTLVIQKMLIGELSDVVDPLARKAILATPGIISPEQSDQIFKDIISSLKAQ